MTTVTLYSPVKNPPQGLRRPYYAGYRSSYLDLIPEDDIASPSSTIKMDDTDPADLKLKSKSTPQVDQLAASSIESNLKPPPSALKPSPDSDSPEETDYLSAGGSSLNGLSTPSTPGTGLSRTNSNSELDAFGGDSSLPPIDRLSMFDLLENFALPQRLESLQTAISDNAERLRRQRAALASRAVKQKNNLVGEWRKRVPPVKPEEQLDKYRRRMRDSVDRVNKRWNDAKTVTLKEKISFVTACLNIFLSGYLIGGWPEYFHLWYTAQLAYVEDRPRPRANAMLTFCVGISCQCDGILTTRSASTISWPTCVTSSTC